MFGKRSAVQQNSFALHVAAADRKSDREVVWQQYICHLEDEPPIWLVCQVKQPSMEDTLAIARRSCQAFRFRSRVAKKTFIVFEAVVSYSAHARATVNDFRVPVHDEEAM
eukprot:2762517-Amphidinium_carterae.1